MFLWSAAAASYIAARIVVDDSKVPEPVSEAINETLNRIDSWVNCMEDLDITEPYSWYVTARRAMLKLSHVDSGETDIERYVVEHNLSTIVPSNLRKLIDTMRKSIRGETVACDDKEHKLIRYDLDTGVSVYVVEYDESDFRILARRDDAQKVREGIGNAVWGSRRMLFVSQDPRAANSCCFDEIDTPESDFIGEPGLYLDEWEKFVKGGMKRKVLLDGVPGTGKTTLAMEAARRIGDRAVIVDKKTIRYFSEYGWFCMIQILRPNVLVIDDFDRLPSDVLEESFFVLDDNQPVDLLFITTNHADRLPDAMLRPGRIDQFIRFGVPSLEVRLKMVSSFSKDVGCQELSEGKSLEMAERMKAHSPAYLKEMLRRISVLGEDYEPREDDQTFEILDKRVPLEEHKHPSRMSEDLRRRVVQKEFLR